MEANETSKEEVETEEGDEIEEGGYDCSPNWADRCRNANPRSKCQCACGGTKHGANRPQDR